MKSERGRLRSAAVPVVRVQTAAVGLALVEALLGYEWLLSALNKILSPTFRSGLAGQLKMDMAGNPNGWWVALAKGLVLPHASLFGVLVEVGELLVALGFFAGAALWVSGRFPVRRWACRVNLGVIGALLGSALMTANYYVMSGATLPGLDPSNPFNEGLSIDGLLTLVAVGLLLVHAVPLWTRPAHSER
jgi:thiosulfate dehydrogenase [quinone] large subunit